MRIVVPLFFLLCFAIHIHADLSKAYSLYLTGEIDSAFAYYSEVLDKDNDNLDAVYGMINYYIAKKKFDNALILCNQFLSKEKNSILFAKAAYIYARKNNKAKTVEMYQQAAKLYADANSDATLQTPSGNELADIIYSAGYGFYDNGKFHDALQWFTKGDSLYDDLPLFKQAIAITSTALKNAIVLSINANGGGIAYSSGSTYKNGNFFSGNANILLNNTYLLNFSFSRTNLYFKSLDYGITYDTLIASRDGYPDTNRLTIISSKEYINLDGENDTVYYTYQETLTSSNTNALLFDTVIKIKPESYYANDYYFSATDYGSHFKKTILSTGCRLSFTNMKNAKYIHTLYIKHMSTIAPVSFGCIYYYTILDNNHIFQFSPSCSFTRGLLFSELKVNAIKSTEKKAKTGVPDDFQFSYDVNVGLKYQNFKVTLGGSFGDRIFLIGADGEFLHNVISPYAFGAKSLLEWTPGNKGITLYYLFDFSKYNQLLYNKVKYPEYHKIVNMGGIYIKW